jgi:putative ABC transport system permease protein
LDIAGYEEEWVVVGVFQYTGISDLVVYANYDYVKRLLNISDHASVYRIVTSEHTLDFQQDVSARLNERFRGLGFKVNKVEAGAAFSASITEVLGILTAVLLVMAVLTALVGSIGLTGTMSMNVLERTREIGVMRAIGADNQIVSRLVIAEGALIGLISYVLGALLSFPISFLLSNVISLAIFSAPAKFAFTVQGFAIWLLVVLVLSVIASILPARNASKLTIREVLAYE